MITFSNLKNIQEGVNEALVDMGLMRFKCNLFDVNSGLSKTIVIERTEEIPSHEFTPDRLSEFIQDIHKDIMGSSCVESMRKLLRAESDTLKEEINHLKGVIAELTQYKMYYDIQMKLNHGDRDDKEIRE